MIKQPKLEIPKELKSNLEISYFKLFTHWVEIGILEEFFICEQYPKEMHFVLFEGLKETIPIQLKTKVTYKEKTIIREHRYTPDFLIIWKSDGYELLKSYLDRFTLQINHPKPESDNNLYLKSKYPYSNVTWVENKPEFERNNMVRLYKTTAKWCLSIFGYQPQLWNEKDLKILKELKL